MPVVKTETLVIGVKLGGPGHQPIELSADRKDEIEWICKTHRFEVDIDKDKTAGSEQRAGSPRNPFSKEFPLKGKKAEAIQSGTPKVDAKDQTYKYTARAFDDAGTLVDAWDPHIIIK